MAEAHCLASGYGDPSVSLPPKAGACSLEAPHAMHLGNTQLVCFMTYKLKYYILVKFLFID